MSGKRTTRHSSGMGSLTAAPAGTRRDLSSAPTGLPKSPSLRLTRSLIPIGEPEPRRSVRATKGQHTKVFDQLENGPEPTKRRQTKKGGKKAAEKDDKQEEDEEIIRCICGATTQDDDDANEPWIACDKCGAWQHNVCMGMSVFTEDLTKDYFCERCAPDDHKVTLEAIKRGEKPWEDRRHKHEEEKKRKKGGRKSKGKRVSDTKERASPSAATTKTKSSPTPDMKREESVPEPVAKGKRKSRDHSQGPQSKLRKVSEAQAVPSSPKYSPPNDLPESIQKLEGPRRQAALGLQKSLDSAVDQAEKKKLYTIPQGSTKKSLTERLAIEIERAFQDTHPNTSHNASQLRTLIFSLKNNVELAVQVLNRSLPPTSFVVMTSDELATKELQRETAEMKARAEKQSILITDDGPRMRRTHKGEEIVEADNVGIEADDVPSNLRRQGVREASEAGNSNNEPAASPANGAASPVNAGVRSISSAGPLRVDTQMAQQSPKKSDFDIGKVFSSVRSPPSSHQRRSSTQVQLAGPGDDPEVDRLLQEDGNESPPYSPTEDIDPDVVWRGPLIMTNLADVATVAKHVGGADLSKIKGIAWRDLIPPLLTVAGRIPEEKAIPYLCGLRYNNQIDLVITSLSLAQPTDASARKQYLAVIDYFQSKKRYGVVGERKLGNVRDTYLVPVPAGDGPIPEPMQNISDHLIPLKRSEPMLLMVFVVRDEKQPHIPIDQQRSEMQTASSSTPTQGTPLPPRNPSTSGPTWSPATPQSLPPPQYNQTPVPPPKIPGHTAPPMPPRQTPSASQTPVAQDPDVSTLRAAQAEGEMKARQVLGPLFPCPTVLFLLPQAARMKEREWTVVRRCLERDPRARDDLQLLSKLLTEEGNNARKNGPQTTAASPSVVQTTLAAAANEGSTPTAQPKA
ncbi:Transcription factor bye1 [Parahypoxylon ruwenzoriense]